LIALAAAAAAVIVLVGWAQRKNLEEMMRTEGLLREARGVKTSICFLEKQSEQRINVDLFLSRKRICAFRSALAQPFIHVPFENATMEFSFASSVDAAAGAYFGIGSPAQFGEVRFFLKDAREWLCDVEQLNNLCRPETCENFDPALCGSCPAGEKK